MPDEKEERQEVLNRSLQRVRMRYPGLNLPDLIVQQGMGRGGAEVFPPNERNNPNPGRNTIEIRTNIDDEKLDMLVATEAIQLFSMVDPRLQELKQQFRQSMTPQQLEGSRRRFMQGRLDGDRRNFDQFMDQVDIDGSIRAMMFPELVTDKDFDPRKVFTNEQGLITRAVGKRLGTPLRPINPSAMGIR